LKFDKDTFDEEKSIKYIGGHQKIMESSNVVITDL
jgi:hypothetical protein